MSFCIKYRERYFSTFYMKFSKKINWNQLIISVFPNCAKKQIGV